MRAANDNDGAPADGLRGILREVPLRQALDLLGRVVTTEGRRTLAVELRRRGWLRGQGRPRLWWPPELWRDDGLSAPRAALEQEEERLRNG